MLLAVEQPLVDAQILLAWLASYFTRVMTHFTRGHADSATLNPNVSSMSTAKTRVRPHDLQVPDVEAFMREYNMQCPLAATRLLHSGLPATIEHKSNKR